MGFGFGHGSPGIYGKVMEFGSQIENFIENFFARLASLAAHFYIHFAFFTDSTDPYRFADVCFPSFYTFSVRIQWRKPGCTATGAHLLPSRGHHVKINILKAKN